MLHPLVPHPAHPSGGIRAVTVTGDPAQGRLTFAVAGSDVVWPAEAVRERTDGLWRTTCFEAFVMGGSGPGYVELNFSPSGAWAAYRFDAYREGMAPLDTPAPGIARTADGIVATFDPAALPPLPWRIGLSAVIEETDGTRSFWAMAHPGGMADFHARACFALDVPAIA